MMAPSTDSSASMLWGGTRPRPDTLLRGAELRARSVMTASRRDHIKSQSELNLRVQFDHHLVKADALDRSGRLDGGAIQTHTGELQNPVDHVRGRDRPEEFALVARLGGDDHPGPDQRLGGCFSFFKDLAEAFFVGLPDGFFVQYELQPRPTYGSSAISRALRMAIATWRWCWVQLPVTRRARILARSDMYLRSTATSL